MVACDGQPAAEFPKESWGLSYQYIFEKRLPLSGDAFRGGTWTSEVLAAGMDPSGGSAVRGFQHRFYEVAEAVFWTTRFCIAGTASKTLQSVKSGTLEFVCSIFYAGYDEACLISKRCVAGRFSATLQTAAV